MIERIVDLIGWLPASMARELGLFASVGLAIGGIDDLAVDLLWIGRILWRRMTIYSRFPRTTMANLPPPDAPGRIAIFVPAWQESAVIGLMLRTAITTIRHADYRIYIGTYPNDPATSEAIAALGDSRLRIVEGTRPGPTTKAECLNRCWQAMRAEEEATGIRTKAIVLHDAEDVVHRDELTLYDRMIERFDLVQIPVLPLLATENWWAHAISATYADEFAESHQKALVLREAVGAAVPSAGVGCAIGRAMMERIAEAGGGRPFSEGSLTEDYELGLKIRALGGRGAFVVMPTAAGRAPVAVCAHFPETMETAIRQKTRWIIGIACAGWDRLRWEGGLAESWMRLRDRRSLLAALVLAASYAAMLSTFLCWVAGIEIEWPPIMAPLLAVTTALLVWRLALRAVFVSRTHGLREGMWSIPRVVIANMIEMLAARRAILAYVPGELPAWDKTSHRFPDLPPCD